MTFQNIFIHLLWIILGIPMVLYPGILLAGVMSLAGHKNKEKTPLKTILFRLFVVLSLAYPVIYYFSYKSSLAYFEEGKTMEALLLSLPLLSIVLLVYCQLRK